MKPDILCGPGPWGNKFRSIGLWRSVRLIGTGAAFLEAPWVRTEGISDNTADLWVQVMVGNTGAAVDGVIKAGIVDLTTKQVVWKNCPHRLPQSLFSAKRQVTTANSENIGPANRSQRMEFTSKSCSPRISKKRDVIITEAKENSAFALDKQSI